MTVPGKDDAATACWSLPIRTDDATAAMQDVRQTMADAGLTETTWAESGRLVSGRFETNRYQAGVPSAGGLDGDMLLYTVMVKKE
ncbi:hypothetical protein ART_1467 [Arthrobacter sp. PAMC 25486]|uniref:hypothetical protein n=1 Tax=Arthrobacter sp. PAMC 25486 TaxID=1494608 RepID=UPI000535D644|nr:hypothetical protein [Arthrobacter sp. PAMC 25486]AIY01066.1 hypothetical protein ART_1467 [Arthrobacter sp. PAMC 25486]